MSLFGLRVKRSKARNGADPVWVDESFSSLTEWLAYTSSHPDVLRREPADTIAARILRNGFVEPVTDRIVTPEEIEACTGNWREEILANGLNTRMRAVLMLICEHLQDVAWPPKIFATEAVTSFALALRGRFTHFLGSEYAIDDRRARDMFPIQHQDLLGLTLPSDAFDLVTTNEVLEHVPDVDAALREIVRVLKPGGWHVGTHPFRTMSEEGDVRSRIVDGKLVYLKEPEIHGNPADAAGGSLVFETPGWNILARARAAGFTQAFMRFVAAERYGVISQNTGTFVLCAQK